MDTNGILRVGGRLENSDLTYEQRHPILLHHKHTLTKNIVLYEHLNNLHAGPRLLRATLSREYWIVRLADAVKCCIHQCFTCVRTKGQTAHQIMANLPSSRLVIGKAFTNTGVDYAGPFKMFQSVGKKSRNRTTVKVYVCLLVCFACKAVHLELVTDLTSEAFLAALSRFLSLRGRILNMYSDQGTNFVGASNELGKLYALLADNTDSINHFAQQKGFQWHFNPSQTPHFGGIWEAGVKSVKTHLKKKL